MNSMLCEVATIKSIVKGGICEICGHNIQTTYFNFKVMLLFSLFCGGFFKLFLTPAPNLNEISVHHIFSCACTHAPPH